MTQYISCYYAIFRWSVIQIGEIHTAYTFHLLTRTISNPLNSECYIQYLIFVKPLLLCWSSYTILWDSGLWCDALGNFRSVKISRLFAVQYLLVSSLRENVLDWHRNKFCVSYTAPNAKIWKTPQLQLVAPLRSISDGVFFPLQILLLETIKVCAVVQRIRW